MLKPIFDTHSIDTISVTCDFSGEIEAAGLEVVREKAKRLQSRLPFRRVRRRSPLSVSSPEAATAAPEITGYMFYSRNNKEEESDSFEIFGKRAIYTSKAYLNFDGFAAEAKAYLDIANEAFSASGKKLTHAILRYEDKFTSDVSEWDPRENIKIDNDYIPAACLKQGSFWHSSAGFFSETDTEDFVLNNIKAEHQILIDTDEDDEPKFALNFDFIHVYGINSSSDLSFSKRLELILSELRKEHKRIFSEIITEGLAARIGLNKPNKE